MIKNKEQLESEMLNLHDRTVVVIVPLHGTIMWSMKGILKFEDADSGIGTSEVLYFNLWKSKKEFKNNKNVPIISFQSCDSSKIIMPDQINKLQYPTILLYKLTEFAFDCDCD